jgi:hypothetical protein
MFKYFEFRMVGGNLAKDDQIFVLPIATNAAWDDHIRTFRLMEMNKWGNQMPSDSWVYAVNSNKTISEGYQYFLQSAWVAQVDASGAMSADVKNATKRASEDLVFTRNEYNVTVDQAQQAYSNYYAATPPNQRVSRKKFYENQKWDKQIEAKKSKLDEAAELYEFITANIVDPDIQLLKRAQLKLLNPNQKIKLPPSREFLNDPDRWEDRYVTSISKDIFAFLNEPKPDVEHIEEAQNTSEYYESRWKASVSVSFLGLFRAGGANAEQVKREQHIKNNATKIDVGFQNIDVFEIQRGEWFDENVIARFAPKLKADAWNAVLGANGQLEFIPKSLLVGRGLMFSIYADSDSLDYLYEHFQAGADAGFFIGWFRVGGEGEYSTTHEQTKVTKFADHIEFADLSGRGKVLAVLTKHYAGAVPKPAAAPLLALKPEERAAAKARLNTFWAAPEPLRTSLTKDLDPSTRSIILSE